MSDRIFDKIIIIKILKMEKKNIIIKCVNYKKKFIKNINI